MLLLPQIGVQIASEIIQLSQKKLISYISDYWNVFDVVHLVTLPIYFVLRILREENAVEGEDYKEENS